MSYLYSDLKSEVKRRGVRDQSGTQFDTAIANIVNFSLFRVSREANWRPLRREAFFETVGEYTTGTVTATADSKTVTGSSTLWQSTGAIHIGQRLEIQGSSKSFTIEAIASDTSLTLTDAYDGTTGSGKTYTIYGREEYNLPLQCGRVAFLWHEEFGYPFVMGYVPSANFFKRGIAMNFQNIPTSYRMWGEDDVVRQPTTASAITISSSSTSDTTQTITVFGTVSSYPDFEAIALNGTTTVNSTKSFSRVERISRSASTTGRITVTANSANVTVATIPVGDANDRIMYKKIRLFPFPKDVFPINCWYYKDPWRLVNDNDIHELGGDFDEAIITLSVAKLKAENSQAEAEFWMKLYKDEVRTMRKTNADKLDYFPDLQRPQRIGYRGLIHPQLAYGQLGGFYGPEALVPR